MNLSNSISIEVPFIYEAIIVKPRCRKPSLAVIKDVVTVQIKQVTLADFPVAIKIGDHNIHWYAEQLWSLMKFKDDNSSQVTADVLIANASNQDSAYRPISEPFKRFWGHYHSPFIGAKHSLKRQHSDSDFDNEANKTKKDTLHREWIEDNQSPIIQKAKDIANTMISVDGNIFIITGEPYY